jgi:hypothetical protein
MTNSELIGGLPVAVFYFRASGENNCTVFSTVDGFWSNTDSPGFLIPTPFRGAPGALLIENDQQVRLPGQQKDL